ncbi:phosphatase [Acidipropionibacterium jensenii]|uniref:HAD family hydrolase n=1 Tax=Acidipropionibacterium jensenii TaxID=1749 RepID=UPI000BC33F69|nr:HAD-IA family hydrolase [Acidipropionibacterium jensenii]AZZ41336.1 phosphatase [Acidipropionibacterium jensenii]
MASDDLGPLTDRLFEAVLFDSDGTLIDSTPVVARSWARWSHKYRIGDSDVRHGVPVIEIVDELIDPPLRPQALADIRSYELNDVEGVVAMPGAVEALRALDADTSAIATSCDRDLMEVRLTASAIPAPPVVVTRTDVEHGKPAPDAWLEAARRIGADPRRCLVVEDSQVGVDAARAAGCATLGLRTTTTEGPEADARVQDLSRVRFHKDPDGVRISLR